jgi:hypothetical protein
MNKSPKSNALYDRLRTHFGVDPAKLPVVHQEFASYERANLHLALEEVVGGENAAALIGVVEPEDYDRVTLTKLAIREKRRSTSPGLWNTWTCRSPTAGASPASNRACIWRWTTGRRWRCCSPTIATARSTRLN